MIEVFGLGYAPNSWEAGLTYFQSKGYSPSELQECGLVTEREAISGENVPGIYDRFRNRIMFRIRDERGRMTGFGARIVNPDDVPKFINSPQTVLFDKGHLLYGLDQARKGIRAKDQAVLVEGYLDVIALHQAGFTNVVSPMGTALTETQLRLLKKFSRKIILALDADAAGDKATLRGLQIARQTLDREADPVFDARGLIGTEARLQADIRVTTLPPGLDPDEVVAQDPEQWEQLINSAKPIVIHVMDTLAKEKDIDDPKVKSEVAKQILPLIRDVADRVERDAYLQRLARLLQIDESVLLDNMGSGAISISTGRSSRTRRPRQVQPQQETEKSFVRPMSEGLEDHMISILIRQPELVHRLDRELQERSLNRISDNDFQISHNRTIFRIIADSLTQDYAEPATYVLNCLDQSLMELVDKLLMKSQKLDFSEERIFEDMIRSLLLLRRQNMNQQIEHTRFVMEEAQRSGDNRAVEYQREISKLTEDRWRLDLALGHFTTHFVR
jgi:DNA primase